MSGEETRIGGRRYRVYQVCGIAVGVLFLALGAAALLAGGGLIIGAIGITGGVLVLAVSVVMMVRS